MLQAFRAKELRHPAAGGAAALSLGSFIANDVSLGGDQPPFMLLTGPNMGGKSTMLRQVAHSARNAAWLGIPSLSLPRSGAASGMQPALRCAGACHSVCHNTAFLHLIRTAGCV